MPHLFLSPHYDDAALSCGATIHGLAQRGERVRILTLMGGNLPVSPPSTPIVRDAHARWQAGPDPVATRRREDEEAAQTLGAVAGHLDFPDCIYRTSASGIALYPTREALFGQINPDDLVAGRGESIWSAVDDVEAFYAPLGVGNHVDHQIVRDWGLALVRQFPSVVLKFYEEYPYRKEQSSVERARETFASRGLRLRFEGVALNETDVAAKIRAIACYRSQISSFWPDAQAMDADVRKWMLDPDGTYAERYYRLE